MYRFLIGALLLCATAACHTTGGTVEIYAASSEDFPGAVSRIGADSEVIYTAPTPAIELDDISSAEVIKEPYLGVSMALVLRMTPTGARKLEELSQKQLNSLLALVLDGKVISSGVIRTVMTDQLMLTPVVPGGDTARLVDRINRKGK